MAEELIDLTPEEVSRLKWEQLLRGKPVVVVESVPEVEEVIVVEEPIAISEVTDDSVEAVLARLHKSMTKV
jgi:hypothetical protein